MPVLRNYWLGLALLLTQAPLPAQVGNPNGYPPGQYPPGNGGVGIPFPRRHKKEAKAQLQSTSGMLRRVQKDQVVMEADDHRILNFKRTDATQFLKAGNPIKPAELKPGDLIEVESSEDDEGFLTAVNVMWQQDGNAKDREHAAEPVETSLAKGAHDSSKPEDEKEEPPAKAPPDKTSSAKAPAKTEEAKSTERPRTVVEDTNPADLNAPAKDKVEAVQIDPDDQGPPVLKRGGKAVRRDAAPAPAPAPHTVEPSPELSARNEAVPVASGPAVNGSLRPEEVIIEKAREAAGSFLETLPNYVCQELMTRYQSQSNNSWQPMDVVSMALVYENGQESYRNLSINGKPTKKKMEDLSGAWSTGEFGTVLADIFSPATAADFEFRKESRSAGRAAMVYDFSVEREHSHWRVMVASQLISPPYKGSVWIDKETNRVLRIEMQAIHIPDAFPTDKVEMATDYEFVRFGERQFLVPVHAETLGCQRDSGSCSRNAIDFRNYHKYSGEASITFDK
ncbi:MAG TPA: hypothetical protein VKR61_03395 [Bryobacteraceae bacterium]|nr:hypothetical protein [Bryobacteraceae bacterium]